jgi:hypothetical protein
MRVFENNFYRTTDGIPAKTSETKAQEKYSKINKSINIITVCFMGKIKIKNTIMPKIGVCSKNNKILRRTK